MTDLDLSRRAVACKGWRAINGMAFVDHENRWYWRLAGDVIVWDHHGGWPGGPPRDQEAESIARALPDSRDPATRGCLLELVREAWGDAEAHCYHMRGHNLWACVVVVERLERCFTAATEAEALVAALEAAGRR